MLNQENPLPPVYDESLLPLTSIPGQDLPPAQNFTISPFYLGLIMLSVIVVMSALFYRRNFFGGKKSADSAFVRAIDAESELKAQTEPRDRQII